MAGLPRSSFTQLVQLDGDRATYSAGIDILAASIPATPTDLFQLVGAANKVIRLSKIEIAADATGTAIYDFYLYKRTVANTGGVVSAISSISHDSQDSTAGAVFQNYTTLATPLGAGQILRTVGIALPAASATGYPFNLVVWKFGNSSSKMPCLRSAAESFCINLAGQAVPAGFEMWVNIEWTEDTV